MLLLPPGLQKMRAEKNLKVSLLQYRTTLAKKNVLLFSCQRRHFLLAMRPRNLFEFNRLACATIPLLKAPLLACYASQDSLGLCLFSRLQRNARSY